MGEEVAQETWPDGMELVRQLREAVGLFAGAIPVTPQEAWEEALERVRLLTTGRCYACLDGPLDGFINVPRSFVESVMYSGSFDIKRLDALQRQAHELLDGGRVDEAIEKEGRRAVGREREVAE